jgi:hypothetical protein
MSKGLESLATASGMEDVHSANKINGLQQYCCSPFFFVDAMGTLMGTVASST